MNNIVLLAARAAALVVTPRLPQQTAAPTPAEAELFLDKTVKAMTAYFAPLHKRLVQQNKSKSYGW